MTSERARELLAAEYTPLGMTVMANEVTNGFINKRDQAALRAIETALAGDRAAVVEACWIVWSNEHRAFWAPNRCGYTQRIEKAGRYTKDEAEGICRGANYRANSRLNHGTPPEICMPAPEALEHRALAEES